MKIYIATHKDFHFPNNDNYEPILVGANKNKSDLIFLKDNQNDNISDKNNNYCELTGLYWIWKNSKEDIVGLVHYRRYFYKKKFSSKYQNVLDASKIKKILNNYDIILPNKYYILNYSLYNQYKKIHYIVDLEKCRSVIEKLYPKYIPIFDKVMSSHSFYPFNMFIAKKKLMDEYCTWLFNILFTLEEELDISSYDKYNSRIYGFISERLFNVWITYNNLKVKSVQVNNIDGNIVKEVFKNDLIKLILMFRRK